MLRRYLALPSPLRSRTAGWVLGALCSFCIGVYALYHAGWMVSLPMLCICAAMLTGVYTLLCGRYLKVTGICVKVERNMTHSRPKWIILKNKQCSLRIRLQRRQARVQPGDTVTVYLRENARLYEMDKTYTVYDYIALKAEGVLQDG